MEKIVCPKCGKETPAVFGFCKNCNNQLPKELKSASAKISRRENRGGRSAKGWLIAAGIFAILGGALGLIIGASISTQKVKLKSGEKVYKYKEEHRKIGSLITFIAIISFVAWRVFL